MSLQLVGYGVDTLILNVRYADKHGQPVEAEREEQLLTQLDYLQKELLGHSQISMTLDVYSHVLPSMHQDAINKLNKAIQE